MQYRSQTLCSSGLQISTDPSCTIVTVFVTVIIPASNAASEASESIRLPRVGVERSDSALANFFATHALTRPICTFIMYDCGR